MTSRLAARGLAVEGRLMPASFEVPAGQLVAVVGPNGGGKTSLLRAIAGIERTHGAALVDDDELSEAPPARRPRLATFLPASREIAWPISARAVIALGLASPDGQRVEALLDTLELQHLADRAVNSLSTGERARVLLARALAPRPRLLLLDEPLSNLDPYWVLRLLDILRSAVADGASALVALHDIDRIEAFDRALLVAGGTIVADLAPRAMLASESFADAFRIERSERGWRLRTPADRRSSR
jgi:iron complex transport system ATP-binding protein